MLSRHFLRQKVLQALYSCQMETKEPAAVKQEFEYHIGRLNQLGIIQLALLPAMLPVAERVIEEGKRKFRPTPEEKEPNCKFLGNIFLLRMAENTELAHYIDKWAGLWQSNDDILHQAFLELRQTDMYQDYLAIPERDYKSDKELAINIFRYLVNRETIITTVSERSLLWEDDYDQIAQYNFMMLKALEEKQFDASMSWPLMYDSRVEKDEADMQFTRTLLASSLELRKESDEMIKERLQGWEFERVALMDVLLVNMAVAELVSCPTIPEKVTIDEYIELSKEFSSERSRLFINGILDKLVLHLRSQGRINKTGRGLLQDNE